MKSFAEQTHSKLSENLRPLSNDRLDSPNDEVTFQDPTFETVQATGTHLTYSRDSRTLLHINPVESNVTEIEIG